MKQHVHVHQSPGQIYSIDARGTAKRLRHAAIFGPLDAPRAGETVRFVFGHDPICMPDTLPKRYGEDVDIVYLRREPGAVAVSLATR